MNISSMNGPKESKGTFEVKFTTEKNYEIFGLEYAKCYANLGIQGTMNRPIPSGNLGYHIGFDMQCGCSSVIGEFNRAFKKTWGDHKEKIQAKDNKPIYTAEMLTCGLIQSRIAGLDHKKQLAHAQDFFSFADDVTVQPEKNAYSDKDGLIEFIVADELVNDPAIAKKMEELKDILVGITSVVTDYVKRYSSAYGSHYKTDADLWEEAMSNIPLMGPSKIEEQKYTRHIKGLSIATDFIDFIMGVVVEQGTSALDSFQKYLSKQGDAIKFGIEKNKDYYNTMTIGVTVEVFMVGETVMFAPKIKQYRINFDRKNSKFVSSCASSDFVDINFDYMYAANIFDYKALEDIEIKKDFDNFLRGQRKAQIQKSNTYFNQDFPVKDKKFEAEPEII